MKRPISLIIMAPIFIVLLAGCGVDKNTHDATVAEYAELQSKYSQSQNDYSALTSKYDSLKADYDSLKSEYSNLKSEHDSLVEDTADWLTLSEEEKAAQLAQADADRIVKEAAAKKAAEEKAAEEKAAAEKAAKKAADDAAAKAEEAKKGYNTGIKFNDLSRNPDDYKGKKVKFTGEVLQVSEVKNEVQIRLATKKNSWGGYSDEVIYIYFDDSLITSRILEDDIITIYGISRGLHSYTTVLGANVTLPLVQVEKIDT